MHVRCAERKRMRTVGIVCEYNPYHAGHAYQARAARRDTQAEVVVAVMSEHTTQRGELAVADGYLRAEAAIRSGVDLVIGLPFPYSSAPAEFFALAGVRILDAMGINALHFGSECGEIAPLEQAAERLYSPEFTAALTEYQQAHPTLGIMECRAALYEQRYGHAIPSGSNDLLAMAYLHALCTESSTMRPYTVPRKGQAYNDSAAPTGGRYPSATALRTLWQTRGLDALRLHLPSAVLETLKGAVSEDLAPLDIQRLDTVLIGFYRLADAQVLSRCADMDGGLAERICHAARQATDYASLMELAATRRYTDGRLRRALLYGLCGVRDEHLSAPPAYVRLLGASVRGCAYLASIRKCCALPILTKPADVPTTTEAVRQRSIEERLEALLALALPASQDAGWLLRRHPYIEKT